MRYDLVDSSPSTPLPLAAAPEAHSAPENSTANQHPPNLLHPQRKQARIVAASESAVSLIKQELTSSEEEAAVLGQSDPMRTDVLQEQVVETEVATTYGVQPNYGGQFHPVKDGREIFYIWQERFFFYIPRIYIFFSLGDS